MAHIDRQQVHWCRMYVWMGCLPAENKPYARGSRVETVQCFLLIHTVFLQHLVSVNTANTAKMSQQQKFPSCENYFWGKSNDDGLHYECIHTTAKSNPNRFLLKFLKMAVHPVISKCPHVCCCIIKTYRGTFSFTCPAAWLESLLTIIRQWGPSFGQGLCLLQFLSAARRNSSSP